MSDSDGVFFLEVDCPKCEQPLYSGPNLTALACDGLPSIPVSMVGMASFECSDCRISVTVPNPDEHVDFEPLDDEDGESDVD